MVPDILAVLVGGIIGFTIGYLLAWFALGWSNSDLRTGGVGFVGLLLGGTAGLLIWRVASGGPVEPLIGELSPLIGFLVGVAGVLILGPAGAAAGFYFGRVLGSKVSEHPAEAWEIIVGVIGLVVGIATGVGIGVAAAMILK